MKENLIRMIGEAARSAHAAGALPSPDVPEVGLESPKLASHGDFSTNVAMTMARSQKMAPRKIADILLAHLEDPEGMVDRTEVAGPGFINFFLTPAVWRTVVEQVFAAGDRFGSSIVGIDEPVQVEFVSANPTGPLHVGHGRGAAVGDATAAILAFCGHPVEREYYINDSGRQIRTLGRSVYLRYRELFDLPIEFPEECYQGDYIIDIARQVQQDHGRALIDREEDDAVMACARFAADTILAGIRKDLTDFGVVFDRWFSEQTLYDDNRVMATLERLRADGLVYDADGAVWFRSTDFGDEKDRVVVRSNGQTTYFASDIAYHHDKYQRGFHHVIDVWGADHHGYIPRVTAAVAATGTDPDRFRVILVKLVNLMRSGTQVAMSTRAGKFETLADVVAEVGADAARFIFLTRSTDSPLDFDLDLAKKKSNDNPVFYVQYVHARISSIHTKAEAQGITVNAAPEAADLIPLEAPEEIALMRMLARFPEVVLFAGRLREPHRITFYLRDVAKAFHAYYNKHRVLDDDPAVARARLYLVKAVQQAIRNGLALLGVSAPDRM